MNYEVVVSYAGEDYSFARKFTEKLKQQGVNVFFAPDEQRLLVGKNNQIILEDLITNNSQFCVMIVSQSYLNKIWPTHEREVALARHMKEAGYLFIARLEDLAIPGLPHTIGFMHAKNHSIENMVAILAENVMNRRSELSNHRHQHPGSYSTENPVADKLAIEITRHWTSHDPKYFDKFLKYDLDFLTSFYSQEQPVASQIPYSEIINWLPEINSKKPINTGIKILDGMFSFDQGDQVQNQLRDAGFIARRGKNVGDQSEVTVSLQKFDIKANVFTIQRATYHDQVKSNLILDYQGSDRGSSIRDLLVKKYQNCFPPLGNRLLADTVGVAALLFFQHGGELYPYLVPRSNKMPVFPGGWHCSASGVVSWTDGIEKNPNFGSVFLSNMYNEIREEIGLFRNAAEKRNYLENDPAYQNYKSMVSNLDGEDIVSLHPVALCREFLRGGKPQLFFVGYTPLTWDELSKRRNLASQISRRRGDREEIDARLINVMPDLNILGDQRYDSWSKKIHEKGFTFELLPLLHYASKMSIKSLTG